MKPIAIIAAVLAAAIVGGAWWMSRSDVDVVRPTVKMPTLSPTAKEGRARFVKKCSSCHGGDAGGTDQGPPLIHKIYEPGHHSDYAFVAAVRNGTRGHHWRFGDMPPIEGVSDREIELIIHFVRMVQRANGIR